MRLALLSLLLASGRAPQTCGDARLAYRASCCGRPEHTVVSHGCVANTSTVRGGSLHVYARGDGAWSEERSMTRLALDAACRPASKPHMVIPYGDLVAVSYTDDAALHILDRRTRRVLDCVSTEAFPDSAIHTASWFHDPASDVLMLLLVDMTGVVDGHAGGIHKYVVSPHEGTTTYVASVTTHDPGRPTKPIAMGTNGASGIHVVTDAFGGASFLDARTMQIVGRVTEMGGCEAGGGLWVMPHPSRSDVVVAQYGRQTLNQSCLFDVDVAARRVLRVFPTPSASVDAHGLAFCEHGGTTYVLNTNRVSATFDVLDYDAGNWVVENVDMNALLPVPSPPPSPPAPPPRLPSNVDAPPPLPPPPVFNGGMRRRLDDDDHDDYDGAQQLQPDVVYYDATGTLFVVGRGPRPVSAVSPDNFVSTVRPGLFTFTVTNCTQLSFDEASDVVVDVDPAHSFYESPDPHGGHLVGDEFWLLNQAGDAIEVACDAAPAVYVTNAALE